MSQELLELFRCGGRPARGPLPAHLRPALARATSSARACSWTRRLATRLGGALAAALGSAARESAPGAVVAPALGGVIVAHEVARALGCRALFTERQDGRHDPAPRFQVLTRGARGGGGGRDHHRRLDARGDGRRAATAGAACWPWAASSTAATGLDLGVPTKSLLDLEVPTYPADACPLCAQGSKPEKPGSRRLRPLPRHPRLRRDRFRGLAGAGRGPRPHRPGHGRRRPGHADRRRESGGGRRRAHRRRRARPRPGRLLRPRNATWDPADLLRALNGLLPEDVRVLDAAACADDFHARRSATGKLYRYTLDTGPVQLPTRRRFAGHVPWTLDERALRAAAALFVGRHDFASLASSGGSVKTTVRTVTRSEVRREDGRADTWSTRSRPTASCARWCAAWWARWWRRAGEPGRWSALAEALQARDRRAWPAPAAARGLTLVHVSYVAARPAPP